MEQIPKNRIGYIDALRGMAMILVVYFHIAAYGFGSYEIGYNDIIERFRMRVVVLQGWQDLGQADNHRYDPQEVHGTDHSNGCIYVVVFSDVQSVRCRFFRQ